MPSALNRSSNRSQTIVAQELTKGLRAAGLDNFEVVFTGWDDCNREHNTCGGKNITDTGLVYRRGDNHKEERGFKLRMKNFDPVVGKVDADEFYVTVCDPNSSNPRLATLRATLDDAAKLGKGANMPADCGSLYVDTHDHQCILYVEAMFAPLCSEKDGEPSKVEFYPTAYNYQSQGQPATNPKTLDLLIHPQGCSFSTSVSGTKKLLLQTYDPKLDKLYEFAFEAENTGKSVNDMHTETEDESRKAAERGKGTAVAMGPPGWDKIPSLFFYIQIPLEQQPRPNEARLFSSDSDGIYCGFNPGWYRSLGTHDDTDEHRYRGLSSDGSSQSVAFGESQGKPRGRAHPESPQEEPKEVSVTSCRVSRGSFFKEGDGVRCTSAKRDASERIAITATLVVGYEGTGAPKVADVLKVAKYIERMLRINANPQHLMDEADATTGAVQLTAPARKSQKTTPVAPRPGIPIGI